MLCLAIFQHGDITGNSLFRERCDPNQFYCVPRWVQDLLVVSMIVTTQLAIFQAKAYSVYAL